MTRDSAEGISIATAIGVCVVTAFRPDILATNKFLEGYVTHEVLALLAVTMTITFASVANVHLSITRSLQSAVDDPEERGRIEREHASPLRREINSSAWLLFWTFISVFIIVLLKGHFSASQYFLSFAHGAGVVATVINLLVIRDIYRMTFYMASDPAAAAAGDQD
ncbi:hypothetical protein [Sphingomonas mucosissima]|uniref:hypothetical protein n=1 Tax=Sphingomonas mucosissima TaxID=370959 RepID=UPI00112512FC|nr:hypothetical protein [Sphingomonas mucosissima]